jgi:hypothetical protein
MMPVPLARRGIRRSTAVTLSPTSLNDTILFSLRRRTAKQRQHGWESEQGFVHPREPLGVRDPCVAGAAVPKTPTRPLGAYVSTLGRDRAASGSIRLFTPKKGYG